MSLILDALNRTRSESGEVPDLNAVHGGTAADTRQRRTWLPWLALTLAAVVIVLLLLDRSSTSVRGPVEPAAPVAPVEKPPELAPVAAEEAAAVPDPSPSPAPVSAAPEVASSAPEAAAPDVSTSTESDPAVAALYARPSGAATEVPQPPGDATVVEAADPPGAVETAQAVVPSLPPATQEQAIDIEQMIRQAENELEDARLAEHQAPFISGLSQQVKDGIPTLLYERHDYSGKPGQSRVVLNGQSLPRGGTTRGVRVEEILPDSVVLRYGETQFRLRALNSWVNL